MDAEEREREQRIAAEAEPRIVEALGRGEEPRSIAERLAAEYEIEEVKAYRWTYYIDERYQRRRRAFLLVSLTLMWLGAITVAVGLAAIIFAGVSSSWVTAVTLGGVVMIPALLAAVFARRIVYRWK